MTFKGRTASFANLIHPLRTGIWFSLPCTGDNCLPLLDVEYHGYLRVQSQFLFFRVKIKYFREGSDG